MDSSVGAVTDDRDASGKRSAASVRSVRAARPGIKEVAKRAGVGVSSVSRVLSGHPEVSEVMRNRVMDAVAAIGYEPDPVAQSMRTGATMTIGFVVGDISNPLMSEIALGAETEMRSSGYYMMLANSVNDSELEAANIGLFQKRRVDGLMLSISDESSSAVASALERFGAPVVLIDRQLPGLQLSSVNCDHDAGISAAFTHLQSLGHTRIALVNGNSDVRPSRERASALRRLARGPSVSVAVRGGEFTAKHGYDSTMAMMSGRDAPTAIIAGGNQILVGVLRAFRDLHLEVAKDVSLVTCDDITLSEFLSPALSTIWRDPREMGRVAARLLLSQLQGGAPEAVVLPTAFRVTESCGPVNVERA